MAFLPSLFGRKEKYKQVPRYNPQQQAAFQQLLQTALGGLQNFQQQQQNQKPFNFEPIAQQARTQFEQQTIPSIAERFTQAGGQQSGAFKRSLGAAGANLEQNLASLQEQYGLQERQLGQRDQAMQLQLLLSLLGQGLQPQFDTYYRPGQQGLFGNYFSGLGSGLYQGGQNLGAGGLQGLLGLLGGI